MIRSQEWKLVWRYPGVPMTLQTSLRIRMNVTICSTGQDMATGSGLCAGELDDWFCELVDPRLDGSKLPSPDEVSGIMRQKQMPSAYRSPWID